MDICCVHYIVQKDCSAGLHARVIWELPFTKAYSSFTGRTVQGHSTYLTVLGCNRILNCTLVQCVLVLCFYKQNQMVASDPVVIGSVFDSFSLLSPLYMPMSKSLLLLFAPLLFTKEQSWANCSRCSLKKSDESNLLFFESELLFCSPKMSDLLEKPKSEFPTLVFTQTFRLLLGQCAADAK